MTGAPLETAGYSAPTLAGVKHKSRRLSIRARQSLTRNWLKLYARTLRRPVTRMFHADLIVKTGNFGHTTWVGQPIWLDLLGTGKIVTIDILKLHELTHPRVEFLIGSSTDPEIVEQVRAAAAEADGPVMVILDGNHDRDHVAQELELYGPLVTPGSLLLSQDGVIDDLAMFRDTRPGPLPANRDFLSRNPEFEYDAERNEKFLLTHHPLGWLRRRA
jgi:cephalosporin hydroxylase